MRIPSLIRTAGVLAGFLGLAAGGSAAGPPPFRQKLERAVRGFPAVLGIAVKDLDTGEAFSVNGDKRFPTASLIKAAVMVEAYHRIAEGKFRA
jgi:beta-lactamase class A